MSYKAVIEARKEAEKNLPRIREAVKLGLEMKRERELKLKEQELKGRRIIGN